MVSAVTVFITKQLKRSIYPNYLNLHLQAVWAGYFSDNGMFAQGLKI
ncbi:MAG: hypothetical protein ACJAU1_001164 [Psychromonas sp.]|jgi:hypothetical protein